MQNDDRLDDPIKKLRDELNFQQPSEKATNDVLESADSGPNAESQFVHSTQQELNRLEENPASVKSGAGSSEENTGSTMPDSERLTEND